MSQYYIYKIVCDDLPDYVYVGSTKVFRARKSRHKQSCNNPNNKRHNLKVYKTIRENGGWDNWRMVLVEECGEISNNQARIREEHYRLKLNANMNSNRAFLSVDEKKKYHDEYNKQYNKQYREANKDEIKEKRNNTMKLILKKSMNNKKRR